MASLRLGVSIFTSVSKKYMNNDKKTECLRYDARAQSLLAAGSSAVETAPVPGSLAVPPVYRAPYIYYEQCIREHIKHNHDVLELGAGMGLHTFALVQTDARVVASDISPNSLEVLARRFERERESKNPSSRHGNTSV